MSEKQTPKEPGGPLSVLDRVALAVATAGGAGYAPKAPGTAGTVVAIPLVVVLYQAGPALFLVATVALVCLGIWAAERTCRLYAAEDVQLIVIDEVAGYLVTLAPFCLGPPGPSWAHLVVGFGLFRLFDIVKPWPVSWVDRHVHGGVGVMLDDLLAGAYAALVLGLLHWLGVLGAIVGQFAGRLG